MYWTGSRDPTATYGVLAFTLVESYETAYPFADEGVAWFFALSAAPAFWDLDDDGVGLDLVVGDETGELRHFVASSSNDGAAAVSYTEVTAESDGEVGSGTWIFSQVREGSRSRPAFLPDMNRDGAAELLIGPFNSLFLSPCFFVESFDLSLWRRSAS